MQICNKCVLDERFPGISFDDNGVCNFCRSEKSISTQEFIEIISGLQAGENVIVAIKTGSDEDTGLLPFGNQGVILDDILKLEDGQSVIVMK